ncbi:MAG: polyprenyl synthetase family protein [Fimbriimonadales bacterium]|nr:polyprenyl synthetase family protein [Fimbriimonadales bacterium]
MTTYLEAAKEIAGEELVQSLVNEVMECERILADKLQSNVLTVEQIGNHVAQSGGKRLRPLLVSLGARCISNDYDPKRIHNIGACVEMIHMATLIHDDVIDGAPTRRGRPTPHQVWGTTEAILTGDVLLAKAMEILAADGDLDIIRSISSAVVDLAEGEVRELETRGNFDLPETEHLNILQRKTATFMACCCMAGATVAGAKPELRHALWSYGNSLGMAFQIADDLLDFLGDGAKTGKVRATDFRDGCATLPLILLRNELAEDESTFVRNKFGNGVHDSDIDTISKWMEEKGAFAKSRSAAAAYAQSSLDALDEVPDSQAKRLLASLAEFVVQREA